MTAQIASVSERNIAKDASKHGHTPLTGFLEVIREIDGAAIARTLPSLIILVSALMAVGSLLWHQSIDLYQASNFGDPRLVALGGILMVVGVASLHSFYGSKLALLCCLYVGGYEVYFVVSGTIANEIDMKEQEASKLSNRVWFEEKAERAKAEYDKYKLRYETPGEKNFQNGWYKKTYVDPAWGRYSASQDQLQHILQKIESNAKIDHTGWLKILYRLGLVFLMMLLTHKAAQVIRVER